MTQPSPAFTRISGGIAIFFAILAIALAVLMYLIEMPVANCLLFGSFAFFPILIAVACFVPSKRSIALRIIGGIVSLGAAAGLIMSFVVTPPNNNSSRGRGKLAVVAIAGAAMAIKGKWPGADEAPIEKKKHTPTDAGLQEPA